ncbi:MAG: thiamine pyrophosphate-binding protein [Solirubrobacteraceae bacterium]
MTSLGWQTAIADAIREAEIDAIVYVPDARLRGIADALAGGPARMRILTREEECIAYAAGCLAAGGRPIVMMQCSGLGNALNAIGSLCVPYGLAIPMVLSMRGTLGEGNPAQVPMGRATPSLLAALEVQAFILSEPEHAGRTMAGAIELAFKTGTGAAVVLDATLGGGREAS